jgi:hypothetical protein
VEGAWRLLDIASYDALKRGDLLDGSFPTCAHGRLLVDPCVACEGLAILENPTES